MAEFAGKPGPSRYAEARRIRRGRLRPIDLAELKRSVSIVELLESVGWKPSGTRQGGSELRGPCPVHKSRSETSPIFSVTPSQNICNCFRCNAAGDVITLAAYLFGIPAEQRVKAAVQLCKHLGREIPRLP